MRRSTPAGAYELGPIATDRLPAQQRIRVEELVHGARFFELPERLPLEYVVPGDVFLEVTVAGEAATRTVGYERRGARHPAELDGIVELLEQLAPWRPVGGAPGPYPAGVPPVPSAAPHPMWPPTAPMPPAAAAAFPGAPPATGPQTGPAGFPAQGPPAPQGFAGPPGPPSGGHGVVPPPGPQPRTAPAPGSSSRSWPSWW